MKYKEKYTTVVSLNNYWYKMNPFYSDYCDLGIDDYPYMSMYCQYKPEELFVNLQNFEPLITKKYGHSGKYFLKGFRPKNGRTCKYLPPTFGRSNGNSNGNSNRHNTSKWKSRYVYLESGRYTQTDVITDFFTEPYRVRARKYYSKHSPYENWTNHQQYESFKKSVAITKKAIENGHVMDPDIDSDENEALRRKLIRENYESYLELVKPFEIGLLTKPKIKYWATETFFNSCKHVTTFRPTWVVSLYRIIEPELLTWKYSGNTDPERTVHVLDPSMGWGDRLLGTMAYKSTKLDSSTIQRGSAEKQWSYTGYDPNLKLESAYRKMIELFGDSEKHQIHMEPFEKADVPENTFDIAFTSPPFFDLEIYDEDPASNSGQSIVNYRTFEEWRDQFLYVMLKKMWLGLKMGGILCLHIGDYGKYTFVEEMLDYISTFKYSFYLGVIGIKGGNDYSSCWCFRKE